MKSFSFDAETNTVTFVIDSYKDPNHDTRVWKQMASFDGDAMLLWWESNDGYVSGAEDFPDEKLYIHIYDWFKEAVNDPSNEDGVIKKPEEWK